MSKLTKVVLGVVAVALTLGLTHAWLNLGFDPARSGAGCLSLFPSGSCNS
jgi:hypothetical protein